MKISILFHDEKIILEGNSNIKVKEIFKFMRKKYNLRDDRRLLLIGEERTFEENEKEERVIECGEINEPFFNISECKRIKIVQDYILLEIQNYEISNPIDTCESLDKITNKEEIIMKVTGADAPIKIDHKSKKGNKLYSNGRLSEFNISNLRPYFSMDFEHDDILANSQWGFQPYSYHSNIASNSRFLGRARARDRIENDFTNQDSNILNFARRANENSSETQQDIQINSSSNLRATSSNQILNQNMNRLMSRAQTIHVRQEDVNRLVNEMGFEESRVRYALIFTRNNVNRAVEILLNGVEHVNQESDAQLNSNINNRSLLIDNTESINQPNIANQNSNFLEQTINQISSTNNMGTNTDIMNEQGQIFERSSVVGNLNFNNPNDNSDNNQIYLNLFMSHPYSYLDQIDQGNQNSNNLNAIMDDMLDANMQHNYFNPSSRLDDFRLNDDENDEISESHESFESDVEIERDINDEYIEYEHEDALNEEIPQSSDNDQINNDSEIS
jgi:hypothetical protein